MQVAREQAAIHRPALLVILFLSPSPRLRVRCYSALRTRHSALNQCVYPASPCWLMSSPSISSSFDTRRPITLSITLNRTMLTVNE